MNLRLVSIDATKQQSLIDNAAKVSASDKNTDHDSSGAPRPQGVSHDIGAFEAPAAQ